PIVRAAQDDECPALSGAVLPRIDRGRAIRRSPPIEPRARSEVLTGGEGWCAPGVPSANAGRSRLDEHSLAAPAAAADADPDGSRRPDRAVPPRRGPRIAPPPVPD